MNPRKRYFYLCELADMTEINFYKLKKANLTIDEMRFIYSNAGKARDENKAKEFISKVLKVMSKYPRTFNGKNRFLEILENEQYI